MINQITLTGPKVEHVIYCGRQYPIALYEMRVGDRVIDVPYHEFYIIRDGIKYHQERWLWDNNEGIHFCLGKDGSIIMAGSYC